MDIRYSANQRNVKRYTTQELRDEFLIQNLYQPEVETSNKRVINQFIHPDVLKTCQLSIRVGASAGIRRRN